MKKRKSTRKTANMIQTALWLPRDMHEQLKQAGGERGLGDEIRRRLHVSFGVEERPCDELTELLLHLIRQVALILAPDEAWWANRHAFDAFKAAINDLLLDLLPFTGASHEPQPGTTSKLQNRYGSDQKPEIIGRILARAVFVEHAKEVLGHKFDDNKKG